MIERGISVTTAVFESTTPQAHFINERCFGEDFAEWLRERLVGSVADVSEPIQEDWGWVLIAKAGGLAYTIAIAVMDDSIGSSPAEWRVGIAYERSQNGFVALFRKEPVGPWQRFFDLVLRTLQEEPAFRVAPEPAAN